MTKKKICPLYYGRNNGTDFCKQEECMMWINTSTRDTVDGYCVVQQALMKIAKGYLDTGGE